MKFKLLLFLLLCQVYSQAQTSSLVSGPMLGAIELRTVKIWAQFTPEVRSVNVEVKEKGFSKTNMYRTQLADSEYNTTVITITGLKPGTTYDYSIKINAKSKPVANGEFTTQSLWQWRGDAPDFSFLTGSCAYFNQPEYDRPGAPYGGDSSIFKTMAGENADFMVWLGDNWYTREADFYSEWGLHYRASRDRSLPILQPFLKKMAHYAIWDDHDFGPDNSNKGYTLKTASRNVFTKYWANETYGMNEEGIYSKFSWNDVDFFLLDDRWDRSSDVLPDSIDGKPNPGKKMFGDEQMEWLKNALLLSMNDRQIKFRIIVTGSQVLNSYAPGDCLRHYPVEYDELMNFIQSQKVSGVLFLTGDRHHTEIIKSNFTTHYPLYDITVSPLTSHVAKTGGAEVNNPFRVSKETDQQNYARFSFTGTGKDRKLSVSILGVKGELLDSWSVMLKEISF